MAPPSLIAEQFVKVTLPSTFSELSTKIHPPSLAMLPLKVAFPMMSTLLLSALTPTPLPYLAELPFKVVFPLMLTLLLSSALTPPPLLAELVLKVVVPMVVTVL